MGRLPRGSQRSRLVEFFRGAPRKKKEQSCRENQFFHLPIITETDLTVKLSLRYTRTLVCMTKQELIEKLLESQKKRSFPKVAISDVVESIFFNLNYALKQGKRFSYPGFGTFLVKRRKERKGRNPKKS